MRCSDTVVNVADVQPVRTPQDASHQAPAILTKGLITPAEAEALFQM